MADAEVNLLEDNLLQLLSENVELIKGVDDGLQHLLEEIQSLKVFLDDAAKVHSDTNLWKALEKEIQKTVHKAEDAIDKFLVQAKLHQLKGKVPKFLDVRHLTTDKNNFAKEIKEIYEKVERTRKDNQVAFQSCPMLEPPQRATQQASQVPYLEDDEVVGFDEQASQVMERLVQKSEDLDIVPIVGMPGLGKTTLASKIYKDPKLSFEFFNIIWVYVGQTYKMKDILLNILKNFTRRTEDYDVEDVDGLAKVICGCMSKGGRCLIVLDDVWTAEVIDHIKKVFPQNKKGHRIMITTVEKRLAYYANQEPHDLKFLTEAESFELLVKKVFGKGTCPYELEGVGKSIAGKCGGVPLAVVVIAGVLIGRPNEIDWLRVEKNVMQHLYDRDNPDSCLKFVGMSYDRLPREVQTCFLYCSVFPRGFDIPSWKLIRMWIAEGLIKPQPTYSLEDIAEFYLNDLINRNLLISIEKRLDGQIKTSRLHDMLHEFCRNEASDKWLFQEVLLTPDQSTYSIKDPDTCRRLCIQPTILQDFLCGNPFAEHVRSFYCVSSKQKQLELSPKDIKLIHKAFPLIRVLDVECFKFLFSKDFNQLFHLRYIAISGDFKAVPSTFGKFWNLQTLIVNTSTSEPTLEIKADIWSMLQLRHIHTNIPAKLPSPATTTGKRSCLQTLSLVAPESCKKDVLSKACYLKKLCIKGQLAAFLEANRGGISNLEELKCLEHLKLFHHTDIMNKVLHLPPAFFRLVRTVRKLTLVHTRFDWSEADRLGQLESLEVLKLKENAFTGDSWKPELGGFSALKVLWIETAEFESWEASNLNFPILRSLVLISCDKLNALPLGLADIPNLQEMRLENANKAVKSAKDILVRKTSNTSIKFKLIISPPEN